MLDIKTLVISIMSKKEVGITEDCVIYVYSPVMENKNDAFSKL